MRAKSLLRCERIKEGLTQNGRAAWSGPGWGVVLTHGLAMVGAPVLRDPVRSQDLALPPPPATSLPTLHLLAHSHTLATLAFPFLRDTELLPYLTSLPRCCSLCLGHIPSFFPWLVCLRCQVPVWICFFLTSGCAEPLLFRGYSLVAVNGLLIAVASPVRLQFKHHFLQEVFPDLSN